MSKNQLGSLESRVIENYLNNPKKALVALADEERLILTQIMANTRTPANNPSSHVDETSAAAAAAAAAGEIQAANLAGLNAATMAQQLRLQNQLAGMQSAATADPANANLLLQSQLFQAAMRHHHQVQVINQIASLNSLLLGHPGVAAAAAAALPLGATAGLPTATGLDPATARLLSANPAAAAAAAAVGVAGLTNTSTSNSVNNSLSSLIQRPSGSSDSVASSSTVTPSATSSSPGGNSNASSVDRLYRDYLSKYIHQNQQTNPVSTSSNPPSSSDSSTKPATSSLSGLSQHLQTSYEAAKLLQSVSPISPPSQGQPMTQPAGKSKILDLADSLEAMKKRHWKDSSASSPSSGGKRSPVTSSTSFSLPSPPTSLSLPLGHSMPNASQHPAKRHTSRSSTDQNGRDRVFTCKICNRSFGYKHVLQNHERTHTGEKPFECKVCHKRFTRDHHLKTHMRLHTGEKPYSCNHCDRQFVQVANLRRHLRVHTGERPYKCDVCESCFSDSNQLKAHVLIHKGEKPYNCSNCKGKFRRRHHLMHHACPSSGKSEVDSSTPGILPIDEEDNELLDEDDLKVVISTAGEDSVSGNSNGITEDEEQLVKEKLTSLFSSTISSEEDTTLITKKLLATSSDLASTEKARGGGGRRKAMVPKKWSSGAAGEEEPDPKKAREAETTAAANEEGSSSPMQTEPEDLSKVASFAKEDAELEPLKLGGDGTTRRQSLVEQESH